MKKIQSEPMPSDAKLHAFGRLALRFAGLIAGTAIGQHLTGHAVHWVDAAGIALTTLGLLTLWEKAVQPKAPTQPIRAKRPR